MGPENARFGGIIPA